MRLPSPSPSTENGYDLGTSDGGDVYKNFTGASTETAMKD